MADEGLSRVLSLHEAEEDKRPLPSGIPIDDSERAVDGRVTAIDGARVLTPRGHLKRAGKVVIGLAGAGVEVTKAIWAGTRDKSEFNSATGRTDTSTYRADVDPAFFDPTSGFSGIDYTELHRPTPTCPDKVEAPKL